MKTVVIVPTYNEKSNIKNTLNDLLKVFKKVAKKFSMHILVVDDSSPDGTGEIVKKMAKKHKNIHLLVNPDKQGLGAAYFEGFDYAIKQLKAELVFEFDADGSHQSKYIPQMLKEVEQGADVVVGSRYVPGGAMPADWGWNRKAVSYFGNFIARLVLWTWQYHDITSGFRLTKTKFLKKLNFAEFLCRQYAYKIQLFYELHLLGAKIVEVPIEFIDRTKGKSKFPKNNIIDSLRVVISLRIRESQKFLKFVVVGGTGFVIQTIAFKLLLDAGVHRSIAVALGAELAIISNFTLNNLWTFKSKKITGSRIIPKFLTFNMTSLLAIGIQSFILWLGPFLFGLTQLTTWVSYFTALTIVMIVNYTIYNRFIWKKQ